jgi:ribosomal protein L31
MAVVTKLAVSAVAFCSELHCFWDGENKFLYTLTNNIAEKEKRNRTIQAT